MLAIRLSMPEIKYIPEVYQEGFRGLGSYSKTEFEKIVKALTQLDPVVTIRELALRISESFDLDEASLYEVLLSVASITPYLYEDKVTDLAKSISNVALRIDLIDEKNFEEFESRLLFLLNNKMIFYPARAQDLLSEYDRIFINSRILTDIRPVFGVDVKEPPECGMVVHSLSINCRESRSDNYKDYFFALDSQDLSVLKEAIERAEAKASSLKTVFEKIGMTKIL